MRLKLWEIGEEGRECGSGEDWVVGWIAAQTQSSHH